MLSQARKTPENADKNVFAPEKPLIHCLFKLNRNTLFLLYLLRLNLFFLIRLKTNCVVIKLFKAVLSLDVLLMDKHLTTSKKQADKLALHCALRPLT